MSGLVGHAGLLLGAFAPGKFGLLDDYAGRFWSAGHFRLLFGGYAGPCLRVRRSSDNTVSDIGFAGGWLDVAALLAFCGSGNGYVTTLCDQTGNGNHFDQPTSGLQPRIVNAGVYDGAIVFDGSNDLLQSAKNSGTPSAMTVITGMQLRSMPAVAIVLEHSTNNNSFDACAVYIDSPARRRISTHRNSPAGYADMGFATTTPSGVYAWRFDRSQTTAAQQCVEFIGGAKQTAAHNGSTGTLPGGSFDSKPWFIGARSGGLVPSQLTLSSLLIAESAMSDADCGAISTVLANEAPPASFALVSSFTAFGNADAQGVATDGTSIWFSNSTTLSRYSKAGVQQATRVVTSDAPTDKAQINGLFQKDGVLYVSAPKWDGSIATSRIVEYGPATLEPTGVVHVLPGDHFSEGIAFARGSWWVCFHGHKHVSQYTADWTHIADWPLSYPITGDGGPYGGTQGYDGIAWAGDYLLCNIHEVYSPKNCDVYRWTGAGFAPAGRLTRPDSAATQGMAGDPVDAGVIWWVKRNYAATDGVVKSSIQR